MKNIFCLLFLLLSIACAAQLPSSPSNDIPEVIYRNRYNENRAKAEAVLRRLNLPLRFIRGNGQIVEAVGVDGNGQVLYNITTNLGSAQTISTSKVWPGGSAGTALTGAGMSGRLGLWDGGGVRITHQELSGRVTQVDGPVTYADHSTHVAGTMIAAGVNSNAKGMAYVGSLQANDWLNAESEMQVAAGNGMLLSNHSYGEISGWFLNDNPADPLYNQWQWYGDITVSSTKDYKYGFYNQQAADWDEIAHNNPYYLICKAAGNDRGSQKPGSVTTYYVRDASGTWVTSSAPRNTVGPYDCVQTYGTAKNILTVGAVNKISGGYSNPASVVMSSFSGWGPTDDGRIKPDIVAAGVNLTSSFASSNIAYGTISGTSMATPSVTGSLLLVQQHFKNLHGHFLLAATLKGLAIHTADEAGGSAGPDYSYGWGLLNTAKAVRHLSDTTLNLVFEKSLSSGGVNTQAINCDGTTPLRITICWTDVPGTPYSTPALDPTSRMIVNDLDIRLKRNSDNTVFYPYILNPAVPSAAATTGDNIRDNVEQIYLASPQAGSYTLSVSHKGTLRNSVTQNYSMLVSGIAAPPRAALAASKTIVCTGQSVSFSDLSSGSPNGHQWYFPGGNPSVSSAADPVVIYPSAGKYPVALRSSNVLGSDSIFFAGYITVGGLSPLPFLETFETSSATQAAWTINNPDNDSTWHYATIGGTTPGNRAYEIPFYSYGATGQRDGLISPPIDLSAYQSASLTFKYGYTRATSSHTDSLIVYISTNCGDNWTRLMARGENGSGSFATAPNGTYVQASAFVPSSSANWCGGGTGATCPVLSLNAYAGFSNVMLKFEGYNNYGNNLYIDNVNIDGVPKKPSVDFHADRTTICVGDSVHFRDSTRNFPTSWAWTFGGANPSVSGLQNPAIAYSSPGTYSVKLRAANVTGADSLTISTLISVLPLPPAPTISSAGALSFCLGDSVLLTSDSSGSSYQWYRDNVVLPSATASSYQAKLSGVYKVQVGNSNGCRALSSNGKTVTASALPAAPVITSNITGAGFCEGGTAVLTSSAVAGNRWYRNGALTTDTAKTYSTTDSGTFTVRTISGACPSQLSLPRVLALYPKPVLPVISGATASNYHKQESYTVPSHSGSTYAWTLTNGSLQGGQGSNNIQLVWSDASSTGQISVRETASSGCRSDLSNMSVLLSVGTGIGEQEDISSLVVYPNPAVSELNISFTSIHLKLVGMSLMNVLGQTVRQSEARLVSGRFDGHMDLSGLGSGIYFLKIGNGNESRQVKLMIRGE